MEKQWAVLRAQAHREAFAAQAISTRGVDTYVPVLPAAHSSGPSTSLFPGYLFAQVSPTSDDLLRIRSAPGVAYVLPRAGTPTLLPGELIDAIRAKEQQLQACPGGRELKHGDHVRVLAGPFKWVEGVFDRRLSVSGRVRILLKLATGTVALQIPAGELEPFCATRSNGGVPAGRSSHANRFARRKSA
jgi:transcription antitermination factor NusG